MRKARKIKKLALSRETLQCLDETALTPVAGASVPVCTFDGCGQPITKIRCGTGTTCECGTG